MRLHKIAQPLCLAFALSLWSLGGVVSAKMLLPEFFGVYAVCNGKLIELQAHPQGQYAISGTTVMGADVISKLSGITFPEGKIEFIVFRDSATSFNKIPLSRIARIDAEANTAWGGDGTKKKLKNKYHLMPDEIYMNVAPLKEMMVRAVPKGTLPQGIWAIKIGSELYDFVVGSEETADCVIRKVGAAGVEYLGMYVDCGEGVVRNTLTGLEWKAGPDADMNWDQARAWVQSLGNGWRMPSMDELQSLYSKGEGRRNMTPLLKPRGWFVWSGETEGSSRARGFDFAFGDRLWGTRSDSYFIRAFAVRSWGDG